MGIFNFWQPAKTKVAHKDLKAALLDGDFGPVLTEKLLQGIDKGSTLQKELTNLLPKSSKLIDPNALIIICGINGVGKTSSIAKLTATILANKQSVILGAGDTYRAAAKEQLQQLADLHQVPLIKEQNSPSAILYDLLNAQAQTNSSYAVLDTAGRLHTQDNLMAELKKLAKVVQKFNIKTQTIMAIDATLGQISTTQIQEFTKIMNIDGLIVTKCDINPKAGSAIAASITTQIPILFTSSSEDAKAPLTPFDLASFLQNQYPGA